MIRKILHVFTTKILAALLSVGIVLLTTNYLGAEGRGQVSTVNTTITFIIMFNCMIGSDALVYLVPKGNFYKLLLPSYVYGLVSSLVFVLLFAFFSHEIFGSALFDLQGEKALDSSYLFHIVGIAAITTVFEINIFVFLGKNDVKYHNILSLGKTILVFVPLLLLFLSGQTNTTAYLISLYTSASITLIISFVLLARYSDPFEFSALKAPFLSMLKYGPQDQLANILHTINYRIGIYFLLYSWSWEAVGIFSVALFLMESVLILSRSTGLVHFSKIVNTTDIGYNNKLTLDLFKMSFLLLSVACTVLALLPSSLYTFAFGADFTDLNHYLLLISPGIIAYGSTNVFNNYFCSKGSFYENILSNGLALPVAFIGVFFFIPHYGISGACISLSATYIVVAVYLTVRFMSTNKLHPKELVTGFNLKNIF